MSVPSQAGKRSCICVLGVMYMCVRGMDFASVLFLQLSDWFSELSLIYYYIIIIISIIIIVQTSNCNNNIFELYLHNVCYVLLCGRNGVSG
jgi:hypothetical protein